MAWATVGEVQTYTGLTVTSETIESAQAMIEIFADVTEDSNERISSKNARLLKMAVAYQAAWITDHPDTFTHMDVNTLLQDGMQFSVLHANSGILAPMAKRALDRLSWNRSRSIRIRRSRRFTEQGSARGMVAFESTATDAIEDDVTWSPGE